VHKRVQEHATLPVGEPVHAHLHAEFEAVAVAMPAVDALCARPRAAVMPNDSSLQTACILPSTQMSAREQAQQSMRNIHAHARAHVI
jgi:hypothetical protein